MLATATQSAPNDQHVDGWEYVGDVAVDSGQLLLIDPCYDRPTDAGLDLALRASDLPCAEVALSEHQLHTAFVCCSGWGDGVFPVFVRMAPSPFGGGQCVAEMRVVFLEQETQAMQAA
jgi:hypothetical protein